MSHPHPTPVAPTPTASAPVDTPAQPDGRPGAGAPPAATAPPHPSAGARGRHIPEIDGLRGVAVALVVIYHVWINRVSGGVDVFFLLSGFLVTLSLVRGLERHGRVGVASFYGRIVRRLFPPALLVLVGVVAASVLWLPQSRWRDTIGDVLAAAGYVVNWRLAEASVDYLASQMAASPVQHYWSLAVQTQFYLVWPLLVAGTGLVAARVARHPRAVLALALGVVTVGSLAYSVYRTDTAQAYTYFDTGARLWEFALGGLLFLALPYLRARMSRGWAAAVLGWLGLAALLVCGLVFQAGSQFPGWAALWPTLAGCLVIVTAGSGGPFGADRLLRTTALRWLGDLAYALYLTHWPVLVLYLAVTGREAASTRGGLLVIIASVLLALLLKWLAQDLATELTQRRYAVVRLGRRLRGDTGLALAATLLAAVLVSSAGWTGYIAQQREPERRATWLPAEELGPYPGAAHAAYGGQLPDVEYRPGPLEVREDTPRELYPGCHQDQDDSTPIMCPIGAEHGDRTIAVVGGSRAQHWLPTLERLGHQHDWQVIAITKSGCLFSTGGQYESCNEWNDRVVEELERMRPDAVFTTATRVPREEEMVPGGYLNHWRTLDALDIPVLGVRDVPRPLVDVPDCVETHGPHAEECGSPASLYALDRPSALTERSDVPDNVHYVDLTELFCPDGFCPAVIGNVLVYHDNSHLTATYARTLAPFLGEELQAATGW